MKFDRDSKKLSGVWRKKGKLSLIIVGVNIKEG